jgi:conjugal transfer pilus assembly protein TraK
MTKRSHFKLLIGVASLMCFHSCFSLQIKPIADNGATTAVISTNELTRIAVDQDRIVRVRGLEGIYDMKNDLAQGAIFIRPLEEQKKPFTLFLATEHNRNYVLHLTPQEQSADTILLKPKEIPREKSKKWEDSLPYIKTMTSLIAAMMKDNAPPGYTTQYLTKTKRQRVNDVMTTKLVRVYTGNHWQGFVYELSNRHKQTLSLCEQDFYQSGDQAIALSNLTLAPKGHVLLYKVSNHE